MQRSESTVLSNTSICEAYHELSFTWPSSAEIFLPGQFVTLRIGSNISPLLRRPFAIASFDKDRLTASLIYERRGKATKLLSGYEAGDTVDVMGPLGNFFEAPTKGERPLLIAGGVGLGPILYWYDELVRQSLHPVLIVGSRNADRLPLQRLPADTVVCTDDGSHGLQGTVVDALKQWIDSHPGQALSVYACGPNPMMKAVHAEVRGNPALSAKSVPVWASMEQIMGCAVGACMGCVIKVRGEKPYARVCTEGPIFDADSVVWE